jgi:hypothetical protein
MRCYTAAECEGWLDGRDRQKPQPHDSPHVERVSPGKNQLTFLAHWVANTLTYRQDSLLWITEWGIWPSSENWHLFYRLRQTYGEHRFLHEAPGQLFLNYENDDLATFLQVAIQNGWGGYLLTGADYVNLFFSHDEYIDFFANEPISLDPVREVLKR